MAANLVRRIVCGVDGTAASTAAVRRAAQVAEDDSRLLLVTVADETAIAAASAGAAVRAAAALARRTEASLQAVCATGGKEVDVDRLQAGLTELAPGVSLAVQDGKPADVLLSQECDLLVLGSRGLHGLKALGSVSERVAHKADCSVLVVR